MNTLRQAVDDYLELRRGLGFKLVNHGGCLGEFVSFLEQKKTSQITTALAVQFAMLHPQQEPKAKADRYSVVRGFASYRVGADPATEVPPIGLIRGRSQRARPYLYSDQEVRQLLEAARHLPSTYSLRPWTYYCFFGLLAVTGMRLGEALNLQCQDIDWAEGLLTLRRTKFGKSRLVPLDASTVKVLAAFAKRRDRLIAECSGRTSSHFFVTKFGTRLRDAYVYRVFWALSRQIGIRSPGANRGPRLHDFRHRFAIETLLRWYRAGEDVERRLPVLSTYLGHAQVTDAYWYLSCTPELMAAAGKRLEQRFLRLSELTSLRQQDVSLGAGAYVRCEGKGRKERCTPLAKPTAKVLDAWIKYEGKDAPRFLFPSTRGGRLSADAVQHLVAKHARAAQKICPSLTNKNVSPHVLRHTAAMEMLQAGVDRSMISIWLGHESIETTQIYLDANLAIKDEILAKTDPVRSTSFRYRPGDRLLNFLSSL